MDKAAEAATARAAELLAADEAKPDEASSDAEETAAEAPQEAVEEELPEEIKALLEDDDEPVAEAIEQIETEDDDQFAYEEQEEADKLKRELAKTRKQLEHEKGLRLKSARPKWVKEQEKFFPYADVDVSRFESRRAFLRAASSSHDALKTRLEPLVAAERAKLDAERDQVLAAAKAEAEKAWGKPTVDTTPTQAAARERRLQRVAQRGSLADLIRVKHLEGGGE